MKRVLDFPPTLLLTPQLVAVGRESFRVYKYSFKS